jgi:hypothetical protein
MANLHRLEGNEPETGGILFDFGNGLIKAASWRSPTPVDDSLELAKQCAAQVLQSLIEGNHEAAIRDTNWASAVAGCQKHVSDWNQALRARIRQAVDNIPLPH